MKLLTGITNTFLSRNILSAAIVVGPLAPSAIIYDDAVQQTDMANIDSLLEHQARSETNHTKYGKTRT
jgi:hypothetical protein